MFIVRSENCVKVGWAHIFTQKMVMKKDMDIPSLQNINPNLAWLTVSTYIACVN